jgi:biopolymer transport protein TolQ
MASILAGADWGVPHWGGQHWGSQGWEGQLVGVQVASLDILSLILQASWLAKFVLLLLALASVISWAIIAFKWRELRRAAEDSEAFLEVYHEGSLESAHDAARELSSSPLAQIFLDGYGELSRIARYAGKSLASGLGEMQQRTLDRVVEWSAAGEAQRLERGLEFLATTGSSAPFVGLFGTVVGIITSFHQIGEAGSASLAVVAPGIAEALIATAMGLAAAIPASIFYNHYVGQLRKLGNSIDLFTAQFQADLRARRVQVADGPRAAGG